MSAPKKWLDFHARFLSLANEERELVRRFVAATGRQDEHYVYAYRAPGSGQWKFAGGLGAELLERIRTLATQAAINLGFQKGSDPEDSWLRELYSHLRKNENAYQFTHLFEQHLLEPSEEGGAIRRVCEASATFCSLSNSPVERQTTELMGFSAPPIKQTGRPRQDIQREKVREKKAAGKSWKEITNEMNTENGCNKSVEAYRSLLKAPRLGKNLPGKNGQK